MIDYTVEFLIINSQETKKLIVPVPKQLTEKSEIIMYIEIVIFNKFTKLGVSKYSDFEILNKEKIG